MRPEVYIFIAFVIVYFIVSFVVRNYIDAKVQMYYATGRFDDAFKTLESFLGRIMLPVRRQQVLRFMVHEARGEYDKATALIDFMLKAKSSKKRQMETRLMAFNFFVTSGNKKRAKELLGDIEQTCEKTVADDCRLTYEIVCCGRHDAIEAMEQLLDGANPPMKTRLCYLLAAQYRNAGNEKRAQEYEDMIVRAAEGAADEGSEQA